ncbi:nucleotide pyrophosphohydrolase, partial [[Eubacterium] cellulosolvens]
DCVEQFKLDRSWTPYHTPQDLAVSISIEAAELLEVFQWGIKKDVDAQKLDRIKEELADVIIYCLSLANAIDADVSTMVQNKLKVNAAKYPIEKSLGSSKKYSEL